MRRIDRRTWLKQGGAGVVGTLLASANGISAPVGGSADLVLKNGSIVTMDEKQPLAEAMAVRSGSILAVGKEEEIQPMISSRTETVDLVGRSASPGIIDAHSHVIGFGQMDLKFVILRPPKVNSFDTLRSELAKAAAQKPAGEWIVGRGFNTFKEGRFPRRWELDEAVPNHPTLIIHWGGQFGVANTTALKKAGLLQASVKDPYGGKYLRDPKSGLPDGVLIHYPAIYSVYQPTLDDREQVECAVWGLERFAGQGVTCIHDNFCNPVYAKAYVRLERAGKLPCRLRVYPYVKNLEVCKAFLEKTRGYEGRLVRMQGVKLAVDGYALMYEIPRDQAHLAIPMHPQPLFEEIIATIHKAGYQVDVHAVGDKGVDWTLAAFAKAAGSATECARRRHRIEHYPFRKMDSIQKTAELGVPVCTQPCLIDIKADDFQEKFGPNARSQVDTMLPLQTFNEKGVQVCFGADVPAFPSYSPLASIIAAMERKTESGRRLDENEAVSFMEALRLHTLQSAYAAFDEKDLGSLERGKCADFVVWNKDLRNIKTGQDVLGLEPVATYVSGKAVYTA